MYMQLSPRLLGTRANPGSKKRQDAISQPSAKERWDADAGQGGGDRAFLSSSTGGSQLTNALLRVGHDAVVSSSDTDALCLATETRRGDGMFRLLERWHFIVVIRHSSISSEDQHQARATSKTSPASLFEQADGWWQYGYGQGGGRDRYC